jgi:small-conductance mechanosensitive channel
MKNILKELSYNRILIALVFLAATYVITKIISVVLKKISEKYSQKRIQITGLIPVLKLIIYIITVMFITFGVLKISPTTLTAVGLSLGVAMGFAFQDVFGNLFGGIIIIFVKPFTIGDKIKIGEHYGEVIDISIRRILIVTADDSTITVPNKVILTEKVSNANSGELNCQVVTEIYLPYNIDTDKTETIAYDAVFSSPYSFLKKPVSVLFVSDFKESPVIKMKVKAYVFDHRYEFKFSSDITKRVLSSLFDKKLIDKDFYSSCN